MQFSHSDRTAIKERLAAIDSPVHLLFFEQSIGCESCTRTHKLLQQLIELSPHITLETMNLVLEKERAEEYGGVDRVPAIVMSAPGRNRIRFFGAPIGYELASFLQAISMTAAGESGLNQQTRAQLNALVVPVRIQVFFTPSCVYCPQMVTLANRFAIESLLISATAIDATEYPDLVRRYNINGVPKTVINDDVEVMGAVSEAQLVEEILKNFGTGKEQGRRKNEEGRMRNET
jgi:glutaredoxin-like protein